MYKAILYYTDNRLDETIMSVVQKQLLKAGLPIFSVSLMPITFGTNIVRYLAPGYVTMMRQIISGLEAMRGIDYVYFREHDVLYPTSHFDFTPPKVDVFYYNENVWRWLYGSLKVIGYYRLISLSSLCANRLWTLDHYRRRLTIIEANQWDKDLNHEPTWARKWGYEPGTKKRKRGGFNDDDFETWKSELPIIDIRHKGTFSKNKVTLDSFKHKPTEWKELPIDQIPGWNLRELFS